MAPKKKPEGDLKNQRIPIMMTEAELKAIDDWSFSNRIRSRGEAIRRLCQMGILADAKKDVLGGDAIDIANKILPIGKSIRDLKGRTDPNVSAAYYELVEAFTPFYEKLTDLGYHLAVLTDEDPVSEVMDFAAEVLQELKDHAGVR